MVADFKHVSAQRCHAGVLCCLLLLCRVFSAADVFDGGKLHVVIIIGVIVLVVSNFIIPLLYVASSLDVIYRVLRCRTVYVEPNPDGLAELPKRHRCRSWYGRRGTSMSTLPRIWRA
jgi:hypothetical protein